MSIRLHIAILIVAATLAGAGLGRFIASSLEAVDRQTARASTASQDQRLVGRFLRHVRDVLTAIDLLTVEPSHAFRLVELLSAHCHDDLIELRGAELRTGTLVDDLAKALDAVLESGGRAAIAPPNAVLKDRALAEYDRLAVAFRDRLSDLENLARTWAGEQREILGQLRSRTTTQLVLAVLAYFALMLALWRWASTRLSRPLRDLADAADASVGDGAPFRIEPSGPGEARRLAGALEALVSDLESMVRTRTGELELEVCERRRTEHALRDSELRFRQIVEGVKDDYFFYTLDLDGRVTYVSPSVETVLGRPVADVGDEIEPLLSEHPANAAMHQFRRRVIAGENLPPQELEFRHANGTTRTMEVVERAQVDDHGRVRSRASRATSPPARRRRSLSSSHTTKSTNACRSARPRFSRSTGHCAFNTPSARSRRRPGKTPRSNCARHRRWRRWAAWPAASRTTSTTS